MEVSDLILADYAARNEGGKFTLVGAGFTEIGVKKFPLVHKLMFIMVRLKVTQADRGKNRIQIRIINEKGKLFKSEGNIDVSTDHNHEQHIPLPIRLENLKFEAPGEYNIEVVINGQVKQSQVLRIREIKGESGK